MDEEFDVVAKALEVYANNLEVMTRRNMQSEFMGMGIMDDIRLRQTDELKNAIAKRKRGWVSLTDDEIMQMYNEPRSDSEMLEFAREFESKLRVRNT